jgi:hypothetical protein
VLPDVLQLQGGQRLRQEVNCAQLDACRSSSSKQHELVKPQSIRKFEQQLYLTRQQADGSNYHAHRKLTSKPVTLLE